MKIITKLTFALLGATTLISCSEDTVDEPFLRPVRSMIIESGVSDASRDFSGTAQTDRVIDLSFRSGGVITTFNIKLGKRVNKGDLLAELDSVSARLAYEQARSSLNSAKSTYDTQQSSLERVRGLYEKGGASLRDYEAAKNAQRTAQASYRSAQRSVDIQQEQIRYGKILAPEDGVIASVYNDINENVSAGQTVAILNAGSEMEIEVGLPESIINLVEPNSNVAIRFSALSGIAFPGKVKEISPSLDQQTTTYPVKISIESADQRIRAGMAATITFELSQTESGTLFVPASAVGEDGKGNYVFVVEGTKGKASIVTKRTVKLGGLVGTNFAITEGLRIGEQIITAGVHSVIDGQAVLVSE